MNNDVSAPFATHAFSPVADFFCRRAQAMPVNWIGRRLALACRKIALAGGARMADAEVEGLKFRFYLRDNVSERKYLFMPQFFDAFERGLLRLKLKADGVFVDVGANAGIYTMTAAACVGAGGRVIAVEPNPAVLERLLFNAALNGVSSRVTPVQAGVSDAEGQFSLVLDESNLGGSSLVERRSDKSISVPCYTLLQIAARAGIGKIDAMKIDIEGAEDRALVPFLQSAPDGLLPALLILENSPQAWKADLPAALRQRGYRQSAVTRMNQVWELAAR